MSIRRMAWFAASIVVGMMIVALWQLIADLRLISPVFLPGPDRAWASLMRGFQSGVLPTKWLATLERMVQGWFLASLGGITLGALIGSSSRARAYLGPTLELLRPLPVSALVPVAIALIGLTDGMVLSVVAFGALWPMLLATVHGFSAVEPRLSELSRLLAMSRWAFVWKVALPSSMPDILSGMRLSLTMALVLSVVGEMLAGRDGLGHWVLLATRSFRSADLFAGVILLSFTGFVAALLLSAAEARLLRWRPVNR